MNVALFGFKKCGKTYYGLRLANRMQMHFIDTDLLIEELYLKKHYNQLTCREIFIKEGEQYFRELEQHVIFSLENVNNSVISLGGGAVLDDRNVVRLRTIGPLVYLKAKKEDIKFRILTSSELPSYFDKGNPIASFEEMYNERSPIYERIASYTIDTASKKEEKVLEELCRLIENLQNSEHGK